MRSDTPGWWRLQVRSRCAPPLVPCTAPGIDFPEFRCRVGRVGSLALAVGMFPTTGWPAQVRPSRDAEFPQMTSDHQEVCGGHREIVRERRELDLAASSAPVAVV